MVPFLLEVATGCSQADAMEFQVVTRSPFQVAPRVVLGGCSGAPGDVSMLLCVRAVVP